MWDEVLFVQSFLIVKERRRQHVENERQTLDLLAKERVKVPIQFGQMHTVEAEMFFWPPLPSDSFARFLTSAALVRRGGLEYPG